MYEIDKKEDLNALYGEYKALNHVVGKLLLVEEVTPSQMDNLAYYNRKLNDARLRIRREAKFTKRSK